nr:hypothetical protein [Nevskia ramosa]
MIAASRPSGVASIGLPVAAKQMAGELVDDDDRRQPAFGRRQPAVPFAIDHRTMQRAETVADLLVDRRLGVPPQIGLGADRFQIVSARPEPEFENCLYFCRHRCAACQEPVNKAWA